MSDGKGTLTVGLRTFSTASNTSNPWSGTQKCSHPFSVRRSAPQPDVIFLELSFQICIPLSGRGLDFREAVA